MSTRKLLATNTFAQIVGKVITGSTTFLISILIAKTFGANGYGDFTKITTFIALFYLFADFGLNAIYIQKEQEHSIPTHYSLLLTLRTLISICLIFFALATLAFLPSEGNQGYSTLVKFGIILFAPTILFQSLITTANAVFQKNLKYELATIAIAIGSIISLLMILFSTKIFLPDAGVIGSIIALTLGSFFSAFLALWFTKKFGGSFRLFWQPKKMWEFMKLSAPLGFTLFCNVIYFRADSIILTLTRSTTEVGLYGLAYKLFEFPLVIPTFFMNAMFPLLLLSKKNNDTKTFIRQAKKSAAILFFVSLAVLSVGFFGAPFISLIRKDFIQSIAPFRILLFSIPIFYMTSVTMWVLIALGKRTQLFCIYLLSMICNVSANLYFVPTYGYIAAAWITGISETIVLSLSLLEIRNGLQQKN